MAFENIWNNAPTVRIMDCDGLSLKKWDYANLSDAYWRLYWNERAGAQIVLGDNTLALKPSLMALIPPYTPFSSVLMRPVNHYWVHFVANAPYAAIAPQFITFPATPERISIMRSLRDFRDTDDLQKARIMISVLYLCHFALSQIPLEALMTFYADHRVRSAVAWMEKHLGQPISNRELGVMTGMHPSAFVRLFRECAGQTPQAYFRAMRIDHACLLLDTSKVSIDEIATRAGFCDRYHFSRVFRRALQISPSCYRKRKDHG